MASSPDFFNQLKTLSASFSPAQRIIFLAIIAAIIGGFIFMISWTTRAEFGVLYNNLSPEDAGVILAKLKENKVEYKISSNGTSISIPDDLIYEKRMELASQGLPQGGGVGFEIFDNTNLGVTEFVQNVNYQRALQGELSRTISKFNEVESARVHIVMSGRSLFIDQDEFATASVVVNLRRGRSLNQDQVQGIVHLVSASVSGLKSENVTVIDSNGKMLSGDKNESASGKISYGQLEFTEELEKSLEKRVKTMLDTALGKNKSAVRISCMLDFKQQEKTEEKYYPENQVVRSEQLSSAISMGTDNIPSGIPGVSSNITPVQNDVSVSEANKRYEKKDKTVNYEIGKSVNHIIEPVGAIIKLSIAVMVDGKYKYILNEKQKAGNIENKEKNNDQGEWIYIPRTKEEMQKFEGIVKRAVNFDEQRGDTIEIVNIPFENSPLNMSDSKIELEDWLSKLKHNKILMKYLFSILVLLLAFIFIVRPLIEWLTSFSISDGQLLKELPMTVDELEKGFNQQGNKQYMTSDELVKIGQPDFPFTSQAMEIIKKNPEESAKSMQNWLKEESE